MKLATPKSPTVKDVAKQAQASIATVSRALNSTASVDRALRERLMATAELHYRPSRLARNLRTNPAKIIALVVPNIQNAFFVALARRGAGVASQMLSPAHEQH